MVEHILKPCVWMPEDYSENIEVTVLSIMIQVVYTVVKLSRDLEMVIVVKAADNQIWQNGSENIYDLYFINYMVPVHTTYIDWMLYR